MSTLCIEFKNLIRRFPGLIKLLSDVNSVQRVYATSPLVHGAFVRIHISI